MKSTSYLIAAIGLTLVAIGLMRSVKPGGPSSGDHFVPTQAPDFRLRDLKGKTVALRDLRGKVIIMDFWASWCQPCLLELPLLQEVAANQDPEKVVFLAVNVDLPDAGELKTFVKSIGLNLPVYVDLDSKASTDYKVKGLPTLYVIDQQGMMRNRHRGFNAAKFKQDLTKDIAKLTEPTT